jgi:c-di-GMP-binding flagellar brake protein YcgR
MGDKMVIKLGEKVQVKVGKDWYNTTIECLGGASVFFVSPPMSKQMRITLQEEQDYIISVVNKKGLYEFDVRVLESDVRDQNANVPLTKLLITSEPRHQQRRSAYRPRSSSMSGSGNPPSLKTRTDRPRSTAQRR